MKGRSEGEDAPVVSFVGKRRNHLKVHRRVVAVFPAFIEIGGFDWVLFKL